MVISLLATLLCMPLVALCSSSGNPLSGLFAYGAMLSFVVWHGGGMSDWLQRIDSPGAYGYLAVEAFIWLLLIAGAIFMLDNVRRPMRERVSALAWDETKHKKLFRPNADTLYAMLFCAVIGAFISYLLLHTAERGQAVWSIMLAFTPAALSAKLTWRNASPAGILISPLLVAIGVYIYIAMQYGSREELLAAWHGKDLFHLALALPATWAGAGLTGTTMGVGWAESMNVATKASTSSAV
jgi:hypothetical protein